MFSQLIYLLILLVALLIIVFLAGFLLGRKYPSRQTMLAAIEAIDGTSVDHKEWILEKSTHLGSDSRSWAHRILEDWARHVATLDALEERLLLALTEAQRLRTRRVYTKVFRDRLKELPIQDLVARACTRAKPPWIFRDYGVVLLERSSAMQKQLLLEMIRTDETHKCLKEEYLGEVAEEFRVTLRVSDLVEILNECRSLVLAKQLMSSQVDDKGSRAHLSDLIFIATKYWDDKTIRSLFPFHRIEPNHVREYWGLVDPSFRVAFHKDLMMWVQANTSETRVSSFLSVYLSLKDANPEELAAISGKVKTYQI